MIRMFGHFLLWTIVCGILYPLFVYGFGKLTFPYASSGSLIKNGTAILGSELLAQKFESTKYFHSRPSASGYDSSAGSATNLGPTSLSLEKMIQERKSYWLARGGGSEVPLELLYTSASGLDPHLSPETVKYQIPIIAKARGLSQDKILVLESISNELTEGPQWGLFGGSKINVLKLNLRLDAILQTNQNIPK